MSDSNRNRRPTIRDGVLRWVPHDRPTTPFVPFSGRGRSLATPSAPLPSGPLSQENIDFLRRGAQNAHAPRFLGLRHTTNSNDRDRAAQTGNVNRPGFQGDAYGMVPELNREMRQRFPRWNVPNPGFSGNDDNFNHALGVAVRNSLEWDLARMPETTNTVGEAAQHIGSNTGFAIANMGGAPRQDDHDRYGESTQKFGRRTIQPSQVLGEPDATPRQLQQAARRNNLPPDSPVTSNLPAVRDVFSQTYGQRINHTLDQVRSTERLERLNREAPQDRRNRRAAAAELRALQAQGRGRPSFRNQNRQRTEELTRIVRSPPKD